MRQDRVDGTQRHLRAVAFAHVALRVRCHLGRRTGEHRRLVNEVGQSLRSHRGEQTYRFAWQSRTVFGSLHVALGLCHLPGTRRLLGCIRYHPALRGRRLRCTGRRTNCSRAVHRSFLSRRPRRPLCRLWRDVPGHRQRCRCQSRPDVVSRTARGRGAHYRRWRVAHVLVPALFSVVALSGRSSMRATNWLRAARMRWFDTRSMPA